MDLQLNEEQRELQRVARRFANEYVMPLGDAARNADPGLDEARSRMFRKGVELGFNSLLIPETEGGGGMAAIEAALLLEEIGYGDVAVAADYFGLNSAMALLLQRVGNPAQKEKWLTRFTNGEPYMMSGAQSEPDVAGSELFSPDPAHGMRTRAVRDGDGWILNGNKSAFITNGGVADLYLVMARTEPGKPLAESVTMFLIEAGTEGLSFSTNTELIGWKTSHHAELHLDNVRVSDANVLGEVGKALPQFAAVPEMAIGLAACFVGLARRAYEYALAYATERKSWGQPIINHQAVGLKLADMATDVQCARLLTWDAALTLAHDPMAAGAVKGPTAKAFAVDAAIRCAQRSMEILGGYGVTAEYPTGGFLNDAMIGYACDFTREVLKLGTVPFLAGQLSDGGN